MIFLLLSLTSSVAAQDRSCGLFAWASIGVSSYNAAQFALRHPKTHRLRLDFSYTYSKSLDMGSDTERTNSQGTTSTTTSACSTIASFIQNSWNPRLNYAPSDFDTRHAINVNWVYALPFGHWQAKPADGVHLMFLLIQPRWLGASSPTKLRRGNRPSGQWLGRWSQSERIQQHTHGAARPTILPAAHLLTILVNETCPWSQGGVRMSEEY